MLGLHGYNVDGLGTCKRLMQLGYSGFILLTDLTELLETDRKQSMAVFATQPVRTLE